MAQITTGIRSILSLPAFYDFVQRLIFRGSKEAKRESANRLIGAQPGDRVLDLGCGTASILDRLPDVDYYGLDISESYINAARSKYGNRGTFETRILTEEKAGQMEPFDICLALGVLHHLDDDVAKQLIRTAYAALRPGGRLITTDPCYTDDQHPVARFLISMDRGQNVRKPEQYSVLTGAVFHEVKTQVSHSRKPFPYTHCVMKCRREPKDGERASPIGEEGPDQSAKQDRPTVP